MVGRIRRPGAGRKPITESDPGLVQTLEGLIDEQTRGDPQSALRWICKSTRAIAQELDQQQHPASHMKVAQFFINWAIASRAIAKPRRERITRSRCPVSPHQPHGQKMPEARIQVISVDTKRRNLLGTTTMAASIVWPKSPAGSRPRLSQSRSCPRLSLRHLRHWTQRRFC